MDPWDEWPWYYTKEIMYEQIVPSSWWTQTNDFHSLFIHVPGFKEDEVRLRSNTCTNGGVITISGERQTNDKRIIRFEQSYIVPNDSNIEEVTGPFKDDVFCLNIPKKVAFPNPNAQNSACNCEEPPIICENVEGLSEEVSGVKKILRNVMKNKIEILRVVIAFSIGVILSHGYKKQEKAEERSSVAERL